MTSGKRPDIGRLHSIMAQLRGPEGCPWDREQTHASLKPYLIEEAYEVIDAIDEGAGATLSEELGDLLLQIAFHAQLADEEGRFNLADVIDGISDKMVRRHPHVFGAETASSAEQVRDRWEEIKRGEGRRLFGGLPNHLPALLRAQRVGEKAANIGFDWRSPEPVLAKVKEELRELEDEFGGDPTRIHDELGDLLYAVANLARHLGMNAEEALRGATRKFEGRVEQVQTLAEGRGIELTEVDDSVLDGLWEEVKGTVTGDISNE